MRAPVRQPVRDGNANDNETYPARDYGHLRVRADGHQDSDRKWLLEYTA